MSDQPNTSELPPCRCKTNVCGDLGECLLCDAISGEKCRKPDWVPSDEFVARLSRLAEQVEHVCPHCGHDNRRDKELDDRRNMDRAKSLGQKIVEIDTQLALKPE
ncbi:hypothetical protein DL239_02555 [Sedimentitalea sp. CY04]|uniref:Cysteine-rich CWC n=1 Tax=Parasedimentitalea denitrificans TaxID=2211118 RepID=A0ABX0W3D8_9RHOB|nr:hypothetical protein [Sedimentitalea sp. CY04]